MISSGAPGSPETAAENEKKVAASGQNRHLHTCRPSGVIGVWLWVERTLKTHVPKWHSAG